jgi:hypothetical protein
MQIPSLGRQDLGEEDPHEITIPSHQQHAAM